jgi:hypothetical protein
MTPKDSTLANFAIKLKKLYWSYFGDYFLAEDESGTFYVMTPAFATRETGGYAGAGCGENSETRLVVRMSRTLEILGKALRPYRCQRGSRPVGSR